MNGEGVRTAPCTVDVTSLSCFLENWEQFHCEEVGGPGVHPPGHPAHHQVPGPGGTDHSEHRRWDGSCKPHSCQLVYFLPCFACSYLRQAVTCFLTSLLADDARSVSP